LAPVSTSTVSVVAISLTEDLEAAQCNEKRSEKCEIHT